MTLAPSFADVSAAIGFTPPTSLLRAIAPNTWIPGYILSNKSARGAVEYSWDLSTKPPI